MCSEFGCVWLCALASCLLSSSYRSEMVCCPVGTVVRCALSSWDCSDLSIGEISMKGNTVPCLNGRSDRVTVIFFDFYGEKCIGSNNFFFSNLRLKKFLWRKILRKISKIFKFCRFFELWQAISPEPMGRFQKFFLQIVHSFIVFKNMLLIFKKN